MAVTALIVQSRSAHMRYLLTQDGAAGTTLNITTTGAATPDLRTDSMANSPMRRLARAAVDGFGPIAAGALTAAQSAALWESFHVDPGGVVMTMPEVEKTAILLLTPRSGVIAAAAWIVNANVAGGNPILAITAQAAATTCWLDIIIPGATARAFRGGRGVGPLIG